YRVAAAHCRPVGWQPDGIGGEEREETSLVARREGGAKVTKERLDFRALHRARRCTRRHTRQVGCRLNCGARTPARARGEHEEYGAAIAGAHQGAKAVMPGQWCGSRVGGSPL